MSEGTSKRKRPEGSARGSLHKSPLAHLLAYGYERQLNGSIELVAPDGRTADIVVADGYIAKARTSEPIALLGRMLLELGYVNNATVEHFTRKGDLHGELLLEAGEVTEKQLNYALKLQLVRKLAHMFSLPPETHFTFLREFNVLHDYGGHFFHTTHPFHVIWQGTCEHPQWEQIRGMLTPLKAARMRFAKEQKVFRFQLQPEVQRVADAFTSKAFTMQEIAAAGLPPAVTQLLLYCLLITKQIEVADTSNASMRPPAPSSSGEDMRMEDPTASLRAAAALPKIHTGPAPIAARPSIEEGGPPSAPPPSAHHRSSAPEFASLPEGDMGDIELELDTRGGHGSLPHALKSESRPPRVARPAPTPRKPSGTQPGVITSPAANSARANEIPRSPSGNFTPVTDAMVSYDRALQALAQNDLATADALCRKSLDAEPSQAKYLALLAWIDSKKPEKQSPRGMDNCIAALDRAIAINDRCSEAFYFRGMLFKRKGDHGKAIRDLRHAAEVNPRHADAVKELREYQERQSRR